MPTFESGGRRQVRPMQGRVDVQPIAKQIAVATGEGYTIMKKRLTNIGPKKRHRFRGKFVRFGSKPGWTGTDVTVLLTNICLVAGGEEVADHLWFNWTKGFQRLGQLEAGDLIEFEARAIKYEKGYRGHDLLLQSENPPRTAWKLSHPSRIEKVA